MARRTVPLTLLSAVLLALALPSELFPAGNPLIGVVCLAPLFLALVLSPSFAHASRLGLLFGALSTALSSYWLLFFNRFAVWTLGGVVLGYMGYNALLAPCLRGLARVSDRWQPSAAWRPVLLAAGWALYEYLKSIGFLGYPWGLIAYPVQDVLPLVQFVDITGVWGLSFLMALANAVIAEWLLRREGAGFPAPPPASGVPHMARFTLALAGLALVYGIYRLQAPIPYERELRVLLVQPNTDPWAPGGGMENIRDCQTLTRQGLRDGSADPDLVVWCESSIRHPVIGNERLFERTPGGSPLLPFIRGVSIPLLSGAPLMVDWEKGTAMNAALLFAPDGSVERWYGKQHPVPFAETVPFWEVPAVRWFFREVVGLDSVWVMGREHTLFELTLRSGRSLRFGAPICFEDAFAGLCRRFLLEGADLWINLTDDYWSGTVSAETQHFVAARFRAIENRRVLIRCANGGVTAIVGPKGEILGQLPLFRPGVLSARVPVYREAAFTPYTAYGDWFPLLLAALLLTVLASGLPAGGAGRGGRQR